MNILITGATGFFGRNIIPKVYDLYGKKNNLCALVRNTNRAEELVGKYQQLQIISTEDNNYKGKIKSFNPELVIHLASVLTSKDDSDEIIDNILTSNITLGTHLLDSLKGTNLKYFINVGTCTEYLNDDSELSSGYLYAATKTAFRSIIKYYQKDIKFNWINVIPYTVYGGLDSQKKVMDYIISSLNVEKPIAMSGGEQLLDFIHIEDVVDFFTTLIGKVDTINEPFVEFYLGTGNGTSLRELAIIIENVSNKKANINWGALPYRKNDLMKAVANTKNNEYFLNWSTKVALVDGIKRMRL